MAPPARRVKYEFTARYQEPQTQTGWISVATSILIDDSGRKGIQYLCSSLV